MSRRLDMTSAPIYLKFRCEDEDNRSETMDQAWHWKCGTKGKGGMAQDSVKGRTHLQAGKEWDWFATNPQRPAASHADGEKHSHLSTPRQRLIGPVEHGPLLPCVLRL